ncbi:hypothetical protein PDIDSM_6851 [Penicillium digitatum]|nr:hypothetical protein PDIDSM_6851 [Penicillium digitatum]
MNPQTLQPPAARTDASQLKSLACYLRDRATALSVVNAYRHTLQSNSLVSISDTSLIQPMDAYDAREEGILLGQDAEPLQLLISTAIAAQPQRERATGKETIRHRPSKDSGRGRGTELAHGSTPSVVV